MSARKIVWQRVLIVGIVILVLGLIFMAVAFTAGSDVLLLALYGMGMLTIGFGLATFVFAFAIKQLQKQIESPLLPPPPSR
jgi:urea transporter